MKPRLVSALLVPLAGPVAPGSARAQEGPPAEPAEAPPSAEPSADPGASPNVVVVPVPSGPQPAYPLPPPSFDPNAHLPSSARGTTDTGSSRDGFDLGTGVGGDVSARGAAGASFVVTGETSPETHGVRRGDTLWEISDRYYQNPYHWPRLWALNPQIQNPHWIYPGDTVRLREPTALGAGPGAGGLRMALRRSTVAPTTVFLRNVGFIEDEKIERWGEVVGSPEEQMILSDQDDIYIRLDGSRAVTLGEELTLFRPQRKVKQGDASGRIIQIVGTVRVDRYNPKTHMVRARIIESSDVVERGTRVAPVERRFDIVPPVRNEVDLTATLVASINPVELHGAQQVVFLDRGEKHGLRPGNRLFAITRGDPWRRTVPGTGSLHGTQVILEQDRPVSFEPTPSGVSDRLYPEEVYAEIRIVRVRERTSTGIVTHAAREVEPGARLVARRGY